MMDLSAVIFDFTRNSKPWLLFAKTLEFTFSSSHLRSSLSTVIVILSFKISHYILQHTKSYINVLFCISVYILLTLNTYNYIRSMFKARKHKVGNIITFLQ